MPCPRYSPIRPSSSTQRAPTQRRISKNGTAPGRAPALLQRTSRLTRSTSRSTRSPEHTHSIQERTSRRNQDGAPGSAAGLRARRSPIRQGVVHVTSAGRQQSQLHDGLLQQTERPSVAAGGNRQHFGGRLGRNAGEAYCSRTCDERRFGGMIGVALRCLRPGCRCRRQHPLPDQLHSKLRTALLGVLPRVKAHVMPDDRGSPLSSTYSLGSLEHCRAGKPAAMLFTSSGEGEGKTTAATAWRALPNSGSVSPDRADMRKPSVHLFNVIPLSVCRRCRRSCNRAEAMTDRRAGALDMPSVPSTVVRGAARRQFGDMRGSHKDLRHVASPGLPCGYRDTPRLRSWSPVPSSSSRPPRSDLNVSAALRRLALPRERHRSCPHQVRCGRSTGSGAHVYVYGYPRLTSRAQQRSA